MTRKNTYRLNNRPAYVRFHYASTAVNSNWAAYYVQDDAGRWNHVGMKWPPPAGP